MKARLRRLAPTAMSAAVDAGSALRPLPDRNEQSMARYRLVWPFALLVLAAALTPGCEDGDSLNAPTPDPPSPTTVSASPAMAELSALGATAQLTADVRDQSGGDMVGAANAWTSIAASVPPVSPSGRVTAVGDVTAAVMARAGAASGSAAVRVSDFTQLLQQFVDTHGIGAATLGIMNQGEIVYNEAVGYMDAQRQVPVERDIMMRLASVTKPITAAAIHKLADDGMLALDDRVFDLAQPGGGLLQISPFRQLGDARLTEITVLHLLQHRGGWDREVAGDLAFREIEIAAALSVTSPPGRENTVRFILGQPLQFRPGSRRAYANIGYLILGLVIEEVSGKDYLTYVHESIFDPLGVARDDLIQGRTFPEDQSDREPWYDSVFICRNVFDPSGPSVWCPEGGWDHEAKIAHGGLVASTRAILSFLDAYVVFGDTIGRQRIGGEGSGWWAYHTGSLRGTNTLASQRGNGISYVVLFNRRRSSSSDPSYVRMFRGILENRLADYTAIRFDNGIEDLTFTKDAAIPALALPEASGGLQPYTYALEPALPVGLVFDETTRTIRGVPGEVTPALSLTYSAVDNLGSAATITFTLAVAAVVSFEDKVADQSYSRTHPIAPLVLPEATGGVPPIGYVLTPTLPAGLRFDASTRTISGTPTVVTTAPAPYTYKATDTNGSADSLQFNIEVSSLVAVEHEAAPESFAVRGNYPNPFSQSTRIVFDLPWPARVTFEVMDLAGRRVLAMPTESLAAGWEHSIELSGVALPSGPYLYRLVVTSPEGLSTHVGRFVRIR